MSALLTPVAILSTLTCNKVQIPKFPNFYYERQKDGFHISCCPYGYVFSLAACRCVRNVHGLNAAVSSRGDNSLPGSFLGTQDTVLQGRTRIDRFNLQNGKFLQRTQSPVVPLSYRSERMTSWSGISPIQRRRMTRLLVPVKRYFPVYFRVYRLRDGRIVRIPIIYRFYRTVPPGTRGAIRARRGDGYLVPIPVFVLNREGKLVYNPVVYIEFMTMMRRNGFSGSNLMNLEGQFGRGSTQVPPLQTRSFSQGGFTTERFGERFGQGMGDRNQFMSETFRSGRLNNDVLRQAGTNVYVPNIRIHERYSTPPQYPWLFNSQRYNFQTRNTNTINGIPLLDESQPIPPSLEGQSVSGQSFDSNAGMISTQGRMEARRQNSRIQFRDSDKTLVRLGVGQAVENPSVVGGIIVEPPPQIRPLERTNIGFVDRTNTADMSTTLSGSVTDQTVSGVNLGFEDGTSFRGQVQGMGQDRIPSSGFVTGGSSSNIPMIGADREIPPRFQDRNTIFSSMDQGTPIGSRDGAFQPLPSTFVQMNRDPYVQTGPNSPLPPLTGRSPTDTIISDGRSTIPFGRSHLDRFNQGSNTNQNANLPNSPLPPLTGRSPTDPVISDGRSSIPFDPSLFDRFDQGSNTNQNANLPNSPLPPLTGSSPTDPVISDGRSSIPFDPSLLDRFDQGSNTIQNANLPSREISLPQLQGSGVIGIANSDQGSSSLPSVIGVGITDETKLGTPVSGSNEGTFNGKPVSTLEDPITGLPHGFVPTDPIRIGTTPVVEKHKQEPTPHTGAEIVTELIGVPPSLAELLNDHGFLDYLNNVIASGDILKFKGQPERFKAPLAILETLAKPAVIEYLNYLVTYLNQQQSASITPPKMPIDLETLLKSKLFIDFITKRKLAGGGPITIDVGTDIVSTTTGDQTASFVVSTTETHKSTRDPLFIEGSSGSLDPSLIGEILGIDHSDIHILPIGDKIPEDTSKVVGGDIPTLPTIPDALIKNTEIIPAGVVTEVLPLELCMGCKIDGGLGYTNHPSRCDMFVMCFPGMSGTFIPMAQQCPYGLFWSQASLTCKLSKDVHCPHEVCRNRADKYQYAHKDNCAAYWECKEGYSEAHCCPPGMAFFDRVGCMVSDKCDSPCPPNKNTNEELLWQGACDRRDIPGAPTKYERHVHRNPRRDMFGQAIEEWVEQDCPIGTIFRKEICDCSMAALETPHYEYEGHVCSPEIFMPFTRNLFDNSVQRTHVRVDNVTRTGGVACFNGHSALAIPKYANMDLGTYFYATFRYKHDEPTDHTQALLYNGDCKVKPSMVLGSKTSGIFFSMKTTTGQVHTLFAPTNVPPTEWRTASILIDGNNVVLKTDDFTEKLSFSGGVERSQCGLKIGWGQEYTNFVGCVDEFKLYRCRPEEPPKKRQDIYPEIKMRNSG